MRTRSTYPLAALIAAALAGCGGDRPAQPDSRAARSTLIMAPGWVAGSGWPQPTVVALTSVHLELSSVVDGNVAVITAHGGPYLAPDGQQAVVGLSADVNGRIEADSVRLRLGAYVRDGAGYNELVNNGQLDGTLTTPLALPLAITVPTVPDFSAGTTAVEVPGTQSQTLGAGSYGAVLLHAGTFANKTRLTLSGGVYQLASLDLQDNSRVECAAACEIRVKGRLAAGARTYIGPAGVSGLPVSAAQVIVEAGNGGAGGPNATPFAADIGANAELKANVFVPNGTLSLGASSSSAGKFLARDVSLGIGAYAQDGTGVSVLPDSWVTGPRWPEQVVTALNSVDLNPSAQVTGDVSVTLAATGPTLQLGNEASVGAGAVLTGNLAADSVTIGLLAQVAGSVSYNQLINTGTISGGTVTPLELPLPITVPAFPAFTAGTQLVDIPARADQTRDAGSYGLVRLRAGTANDNTVLTLTGGIYAMADLDMAANSRVECAAPCEIRIKNRLTPPALGAMSIGPAAGSGLNTADVRIFVEGKNGGLGGPSAMPFAAATGPNSTVRGMMFVPNGTLNLRAGTNARGRFVGKDVLIGAGTTELGGVLITEHPADLVATEGESATFSCAASGPSLQYRWQKNGDDIPGATAASYTIGSVADSDVGEYRCIASNAFDAATSAAATLTVSLQPPAITQHPQAVTAPEGQSATFTCAASGTARRFQWQKDGEDIAGAADATFTIAAAVYTDAAAYRCVVSNTDGGPGLTGGGSAVSDAAILTVALDAPAITQQPADVTAAEGASASFTCDASGTLRRLQWQKDGDDIPGATSETFTIPVVERSHAGAYRCVASNEGVYPNTTGGSAISEPAMLTVALNAPAITQHPVPVTAREGTSASFTCVASGEEVRYQWQKDGDDIPGATGNTLTIDPVTAQHVGAYRCVATNSGAGQGTTGGGTATSDAAALTVELNPPAIIIQPVALEVTQGQSATFHCQASGTDVRYQWQKGGDDIDGATDETFTIDEVTDEHVGAYRCVANNTPLAPGLIGGGTATSDAAGLTVNLIAPEITQHPASQTVPEGASASFTCSASGLQVRYRWQEGGDDIAGATDATFTIAEVAHTDAGSYRCVADNTSAGPGLGGGGTATSNSAELTVALAPAAITQHPADVTATEGQPASFTCSASGNLVRYQWQKDGDDIAGATDETFTIAAVADTDAGAYRCVATNAGAGQGTTGGGTAISNPAALSVVLRAPTITLHPQDVTVVEGQPFSLACDAEGTDVDFEWEHEMLAIAGATDEVYSVASAEYTDAGSYRCLAYNATAGVYSNPATVTVSLTPAAITQHPQSLTVTEGQPATFSCVASGNVVRYRWQKNQQDIPGATDATFTIAAAATADIGAYRCIADNTNAGPALIGGGTAVSSEATLGVTPLFSITQHPQSVAVVEGDSFALTVEASGGPHTYQWQRDGVNVDGATEAIYRKQAAAEDDGAQYRVIVSSGSASVTSEAATITVLDARGPSLTVDNAPAVTVTGDSIVITGTAIDNSGGGLQTTLTNNRFPGQEFGVVPNPDGSFEGELPLSLGENVITITVTDSQGRTTTHTVVVTVEATAVPRVAITEPLAGAFIQDSRVTVRGRVISTQPAGDIRLTLGSLVAYPESAGEDQYTFEFANAPLVAGPNQLTVVAETPLGSASAAVVVTRGEQPPPPPSSAPPVISLAIAEPEVFATGDSFEVRGTVTAQTCIASVTVAGVAASITGSGNSISFARLLAFGTGDPETLEVEVVATDCNGLSAEQTFRIRRDATAPVISLEGLQLAPAVNGVAVSPYRLRGSITEANLAGIQVNDQSVGALPGGAADAWTLVLDVPVVRNQVTTFDIQAWDRAGNLSTRTVLLRLETSFDVEILSPVSGSEHVVSGEQHVLEVVARATGMAATDTFAVSVDGAAPIALTRTGDYGRGLVAVPATAGGHTLEVSVRDAASAQLAAAATTVQFVSADSIPLAVVRQEPANDAADVEANAFIAIYFNRAVDPSQLELSVVESAHGRIYAQTPPGTDLQGLSEVALAQVDREREPVPGMAVNFPGNTLIAFHPSRDFAYGGTVFVELRHQGQPLWHSRFSVRSLPTLVDGFAADQRQMPLQGIEVSLPDLGRVAVTDSDGHFAIGYGEPAASMLPPGRHRLVFNPGLKNRNYGTVERFLDVASGERISAGVVMLPILTAAEPFRRIESRQSAPAVLAGGDVVLELSGADLVFPDGQPAGDVHTDFVAGHELPYGAPGSCLPSFGFAISPAAIEVSGPVQVTLALPTFQNSYDYVQSLPERLLLIGLDPATLTLMPVGVVRVDHAGLRVQSEGPLALQRLDFLGVSAGPPDIQALLARVVSGELGMAALLSELEARP